MEFVLVIFLLITTSFWLSRGVACYCVSFLLLKQLQIQFQIVSLVQFVVFISRLRFVVQKYQVINQPKDESVYEEINLLGVYEANCTAIMYKKKINDREDVILGNQNKRFAALASDDSSSEEKSTHSNQ
ncbi:Hypothetical_protein [Hexamita inflata]|uniref:Hypothetical_protein n=1 Tax=Hexamita inflata TaxID=28002 RepID=A0AA86TSR9_9EUKA|nr:Hypothetical protein HINF_LOCUS14685 [Hexamita inflata]